MSETNAQLLVAIFTGYIGVGVSFAVVFVVWGVERIDPLARSASWTFRLLIVPGVVTFWPLLLVRWCSGSIAPPVELNPHRVRARRAR